MNESRTTVQGWVGSDVTIRDTRGGQLTTFRLGSTPRYLRGDAWVDGETSWFTVNCWRGLARNVADSVHKGEAVLVHGKVRVDTWRREGQPDSVRVVIDADAVGHDLCRGTAAFRKGPLPADPGHDAGAAKEAVHSFSDRSPQLDPFAGSEVRPRPPADSPAA